MTIEETKHDLFLKRAQVTIAILAGLATLILGVYNVQKTLFADKGPGALSVFVRSDKGSPVPAASIELLTMESAFVNASETQNDGKFLKNDMDAGSYQVKISRAGFEAQFMTVQIKPKKTSNLEIVLKPIPQASASPSPVQSALQEVGASWIKKLGKVEPARQDAAQK